MRSPLACGIDFGTSNSTVGLAHHNGARLAAVEGEHKTIPSALFFGITRQETLFGREAMQAYVNGEDGRLLRSLKSVLGTSLIHEKTRIRKENMAFSDILGRFFRHLRLKAEEDAGQGFDHVVLGRPVHFVDHNPKADGAAQAALEGIARAQGFSAIAFQYEPIAAALDYEQHLTHEDLVLIVDVGGGTSDFSLIRVSPERAKQADRADDILANGGVHVGGTDFDRLFSLKEVMPHFGFRTLTKDGRREVPSRYYHDLATWHRINWLYTPATIRELKEVRYEAAEPEKVERLIRTIDDQRGHDIVLEMERVKIALTDVVETTIALADRLQPLAIATTRQAFDDAIADGIAQVRTTVSGVLQAARLRASEVKTIFFTGGSSAVPVLRHGVMSLLPQARTVDGDRLGSVGTGLALDSFRKFR